MYVGKNEMMKMRSSDKNWMKGQ